MDLVIARNDLSRVLSRAASIAEAKSPTTALKCALLDASDGKLTVRATSLMVGVETSATAIVKTPGVVAVEAKRAAEIAKNLPAGDIRLRIAKERLEVSNGNARFNLATVAPEQFPALPDSREAKQVLNIDAKAFGAALAAGSYAMVNDDTRPEQSATHFVVEADGVRFFSTDRLRMATSFLGVAATATKMLVPLRAIQEVKKLADSSKDGALLVSEHAGNAFFAVDDQTLVVKLQDDVFPAVRAVMNAELEKIAHWVTFNRDALIESIKRVALVPIETAGKFSLTFGFSANGELRISGADQANEGEDVLACDSAVDMEIELPPEFMIQAAASIADDEVKLGIRATKAPVVVMGATSSDAWSLVSAISKPGK